MQGIYYTKFLRVASDLRQLKAQVLREGAEGGEVGVIAPFLAVCVWGTDAQSGKGRGVGEGEAKVLRACIRPKGRASERLHYTRVSHFPYGRGASNGNNFACVRNI